MLERSGAIFIPAVVCHDSDKVRAAVCEFPKQPSEAALKTDDRAEMVLMSLRLDGKKRVVYAFEETARLDDDALKAGYQVKIWEVFAEWDKVNFIVRLLEEAAVFFYKPCGVIGVDGEDFIVWSDDSSLLIKEDLAVCADEDGGGDAFRLFAEFIQQFFLIGEIRGYDV